MKKLEVVSVALILVVMTSTFAVVLRAAPEPTINVRSLEYNVQPVKTQEISAAELDATPPDPVPFNVDMVNAETTSGGTGVYVAVLDTGLLSNYLWFFPPSGVDIKEEWGKGYTHDVAYNPATKQLDFGPLRDDRGFITHDQWNPNPAPNPFGTGLGSGHGTHMTSIITGYRFWRGTVDTWIKGIAPKVTIIPVLVLDDWLYYNSTDGYWYLETGGTDEMVAAGITYIGDLARDNPNKKFVINMSLGGPEPTTIIENAIDYAIGEGVIIVASAGNSGYAGMGWPGAYPQVISVAAAGWTQEYGGGYYTYYWWWWDVPEKLNTVNYVYDPTTGETYHNNWHTYLTDFSSRANRDLGQNWRDLDVATPGAAIRGPYKPYGTTQWAFYAVWGTSPAAPHVSATAALLLESYPSLNQFTMEQILKYAALKIPMAADGAYVSDVFSNYATWYYYWKDHDSGSGFLTVDEAMKTAVLFARSSRGHIAA